MISNESKIRDAYDDIKISITDIKRNPNQKNLNALKSALDKMFPDSKCSGVLYTDNKDKLFFGLIAMPIVPADEVIRTITKDEVRLRVSEYFLEIDGKLIGEFVGLTDTEITCMIIHEVGALTNSSAPAEETVKNIDQYLLDHKMTLKLSDLVHYKEILSFGFRDALRKCTSIFEIGKYKEDEDTFASIITWDNYSEAIKKGLAKLESVGYNYKREVDTKFIGLSWVIRVYNDVLGYRISALKTLERMTELTPSQIEKKEFDNFARRLNRIDDDMLLESMNIQIGVPTVPDNLLDEIRSKKPSPYSTNSFDSLDMTQNDLVGIQLKQENLNANEPDAIPDLLRSINNRMTMIKDYAENNEDSKETFKQWDDMYRQLAVRRNQLKKAKFYCPKKAMIKRYKKQADQ